MNSRNKMTQAIIELKKQHSAIILAHNYQLPEIQDIADFIGDSLELSRKAADTDAEMIIFCGVLFMAETAKILAPQKQVILPVITAGCPMADMIQAEQLIELKTQYPDVPVVCYVNSSAEVKAFSDICCTSANALKIVASLSSPRVIFIPDEGLGGYVAENSNKEIILFPGYCPTHYLIKKEDLLRAKELFPGIPVLVHPECQQEIRHMSDFIAGTGSMVKIAREHPSNEFIIGTEEGMIYRLKTLIPEKQFHLLSSKLLCPNMKKTSIESVYKALQQQEHPIYLPENTMELAYNTIAKMLAVD